MTSVYEIQLTVPGHDNPGWRVPHSVWVVTDGELEHAVRLAKVRFPTGTVHQALLRTSRHSHVHIVVDGESKPKQEI